MHRKPPSSDWKTDTSFDLPEEPPTGLTGEPTAPLLAPACLAALLLAIEASQIKNAARSSTSEGRGTSTGADAPFPMPLTPFPKFGIGMNDDFLLPLPETFPPEEGRNRPGSTPPPPTLLLWPRSAGSSSSESELSRCDAVVRLAIFEDCPSVVARTGPRLPPVHPLPWPFVFAECRGGGTVLDLRPASADAGLPGASERSRDLAF
mmetsp:Transcript_29122/g.73071  ORF Transcript_29122/g.73071 Transcript_29122/m.73071 type:complete len:206 (-) Transcript_29122:116-733(-)